MFDSHLKNNRHISRLLVGIALLSVCPAAVMSLLAVDHLGNIRQVSAEESRSFFVSSQKSRLRESLWTERERLSRVFSRIQADTRALRALSEAVVEHAGDFAYRNGSRYRADADGFYANPDDGNSALYCPPGGNCATPLIAATESLDLVMKPEAKSESRVMLSWFISEEGFSRAYPWRNFKTMPRDSGLTSWPFYFLADAEHNPGGGEIFTNPYLDPLSGEWMVSCIAPVLVQGRHRGTVGVDVTIQKIVRDIQELALSANTGSMLLTARGDIIAASDKAPLEHLGLSSELLPQEQSLTQSSAPEVAALAERILSLPESVETMDLADHSFLIGHATVGPLGWKLIGFTPMADVLSGAYESSLTISRETRRLQSGFLHILIFTTVVATLGTLLLIIRLSKGLRGLLAGVGEFARGNLEHRVPETGRGVYGGLGSALNTMATTLLSNHREMIQLQAEAERDRKLAAVGRLAAGIAHEVNNPLATISTCTQMLLRRKDLPEDAGARLETVLSEIGRIQEKLQNLLDLSRSQSPVRVPMNPDALVRGLFDLVRHEANARGVDLTLRLAADVEDFPLDKSGVKQVLWNLVGNALDFSQPGQRITIATTLAGGGGAPRLLTIDVEDEGPGIDPQVMGRIFEPFFTTKETGRGTGLGLAVSYRIVQDHHGKLTVENLEPRGCRFRVALPEGKDT